MALPSLKLTEKILKDKNELSTELSKIIEVAAASAIKERGTFTIGLSGMALYGWLFAGYVSNVTNVIIKY